MDEKVKWTNLSKAEIRDLMKNLVISRNIVKKLLKKNGYVKRKLLKMKSIGEHENRDEQFVKISGLRKKYDKSPNPVISIDAKKKGVYRQLISRWEGGVH